MVKTKYFAFALFAVFVLSVLCASPAFASDTTSFSIALDTNQIQYKIPAGTTFNGTIATNGMIRFWVSAPNGEQIENLGLVETTTSFGFTAPQNGTYTFNFENDMPNTVTVTFTYSTDPQLPNSNTGAPSIFVWVVVAVAVVGSLLIFFGIRRKTKKAMAAYKKAQANKS
jgi:hypothetical protein